MEDIIRKRIAELERKLEKYKKKITPERNDIINSAIEIEKIHYAITQLYICLGSK